jgi:hypothetical protein
MRLLILGCSRRKIQVPEPLPALARYDGPAFRVVRRYLDQTQDDALDVFIVSARHGLIAADERIAPYDEQLGQSSPEFCAAVRNAAADILRRGYTSACLLAGMRYRCLLEGSLTFSPQRMSIIYGSVGMRLSRLRDWLAGCVDQEPHGCVARSDDCTDAINGETLERLRSLLPVSATHASVWNVIVDGELVPVKKAVSAITGLPVSDFHTDYARRVAAVNGLRVVKSSARLKE